jgi:hypothetical protein
MSAYRNRVGVSVSGTPGTGTITLGPALTKYQSLATAYGANATVDALLVDGDAWGIERDCAYNHAGGQLARGVHESSSTGAQLSLTSAAKVYVTLTAAVLQGATANGRTLARFTPRDNQPPASAFATLDTRNGVLVLDFDDTAVEAAVFVGVIPEGATLTAGLQVRISWMATTATSGSVRWGVQWERAGTDLDANSFESATEDHSTTSGTSGIETVTTITSTAIDGLTPGDRFRLWIYRDVSDTTNDTMVGDAELVSVEVRQVA